MQPGDPIGQLTALMAIRDNAAMGGIKEGGLPIGIKHRCCIWALPHFNGRSS
jgi:hypothetical protein